jgi:restriction endonuclease S subunit
MKFPPYPKYKPSGVAWLGDVPEHWEVLAFKRRFHLVNGGTPSSSEETYWEGDIAWFTPEDLGRHETKIITASRRQITKEGLANCGATFTPAGSVLVSTRAPIGHVAVTGVGGCCNQGCRMLVPENSSTSADFAYYAVIASKEILQNAGKGTTFLELSAGALGEHRFVFPPPSEQQAIAAFLDRETGRLDRLVGRKRELIERLKEKRTALISRTVTRGLPPAAARAAGLPENPTLKPSGIPWLGDIPEHWEVKRLKFVLKEHLQYGANESSENDDPDLPRYVRITDIDVQGKLRPETYRSLPYEIAKDYFLEDGDVLFARSGATSGKTFLYRKEWGTCAYAGYLIRARLNQRKIDPRFLRHFTDSTQYWQWLSSSLIQATIQNVSAEKYADLTLALPPLPEQAAIAAYLDQETAKLDALVAKVEAAIERLQEYRTDLITAAVTGKIDVRGAAPTTD